MPDRLKEPETGRAVKSHKMLTSIGGKFEGADFFLLSSMSIIFFLEVCRYKMEGVGCSAILFLANCERGNAVGSK